MGGLPAGMGALAAAVLEAVPWLKDSWRSPLTLPGPYRPQGWVTSGQKANREHNPIHQQIIGLMLKQGPAHQSKTQFFPPHPSHQEAYTRLFASCTRRQTEEARRTTISQWPEWKPHYRKLIRIRKQRVMSQMKGEDKTPKTTK